MLTDETRQAIESILMVADHPVEPSVLAQLLEVPKASIEETCLALAAEYEAQGRGFVLVQVAGGYRFQSHPDLAPYVERFVLDGQTSRLSSAALETLAIVAYKQPISRMQIAAIRGVNVDGVLRTLQQRGYVDEVSRDPGPGNAVLFGTTPLLLERVGLNSLDDLPPLADFVPGADVVEALEEGLRPDPLPEPVADQAQPSANEDAEATDETPTLDAAASDEPEASPDGPVDPAGWSEPGTSSEAVNPDAGSAPLDAERSTPAGRADDSARSTDVAGDEGAVGIDSVLDAAVVEYRGETPSVVESVSAAGESDADRPEAATGAPDDDGPANDRSAGDSDRADRSGPTGSGPGQLDPTGSDEDPPDAAPAIEIDLTIAADADAVSADAGPDPEDLAGSPGATVAPLASPTATIRHDQAPPEPRDASVTFRPAPGLGGAGVETATSVEVGEGEVAGSPPERMTGTPADPQSS